MQTQRQQLNLLSKKTLSYGNIDDFTTCMNEHYHYTVEKHDMKTSKGNTKGSVIVIKNYSDDFMDKLVPSLSTMKEEDELSEICLENVSDDLSDIISHINGQLDSSMDDEFNIEKCSLQLENLNYSALKDVVFSIYTGKDDFKLSFKWLKNNKAEGRKIDVTINNGDAYLVIMEDSDEYTIGESSEGVSSNKKVVKKKEKKATTSKKKEKKAKTSKKNPLNDTKIYTSRELFVNGKSGDVVKGKNGSKLRVAIHKVSRDVFKKVEDNWTEEGNLKFKELFPDGKSVSKKKTKKAPKEKVAKKKAPKKKAPKKKVVEEKVVEEETNVIKQDLKNDTNTVKDVDEEVDDLSDELVDDLDIDDIDDPWVAEDGSIQDEDNDLQLIEETVIEENNDSEVENNSSDDEEDDEDDEESVELNNELTPDTYDDTDKAVVVPKSNECKLSMTTTLTINLTLTTIPSTITLCDEFCNRKEERKVYLLLNKDIKELSIGKGHRIGNRIYGFETDYPVYNVIMM